MPIYDETNIKRPLPDYNNPYNSAQKLGGSLPGQVLPKALPYSTPPMGTIPPAPVTPSIPSIPTEPVITQKPGIMGRVNNLASNINNIDVGAKINNAATKISNIDVIDAGKKVLNKAGNVGSNVGGRLISAAKSPVTPLGLATGMIYESGKEIVNPTSNQALDAKFGTNLNGDSNVGLEATARYANVMDNVAFGLPSYIGQKLGSAAADVMGYGNDYKTQDSPVSAPQAPVIAKPAQPTLSSISAPTTTPMAFNGAGNYTAQEQDNGMLTVNVTDPVMSNRLNALPNDVSKVSGVEANKVYKTTDANGRAVFSGYGDTSKPVWKDGRTEEYKQEVADRNAAYTDYMNNYSAETDKIYRDKESANLMSSVTADRGNTTARNANILKANTSANDNVKTSNDSQRTVVDRQRLMETARNNQANNQRMIDQQRDASNRGYLDLSMQQDRYNRDDKRYAEMEPQRLASIRLLEEQTNQLINGKPQQDSITHAIDENGKIVYYNKNGPLPGNTPQQSGVTRNKDGTITDSTGTYKQGPNGEAIRVR